MLRRFCLVGRLLQASVAPQTVLPFSPCQARQTSQLVALLLKQMIRYNLMCTFVPLHHCQGRSAHCGTNNKRSFVCTCACTIPPLHKAFSHIWTHLIVGCQAQQCSLHFECGPL